MQVVSRVAEGFHTESLRNFGNIKNTSKAHRTIP